MKNLTVSNSTAALLECMHALNNHRAKMVEALSQTYSEPTAYKFVMEKYDPIFIELKSVVNGFFIDVVEERVEIDGEELKEI